MSGHAGGPRLDLSDLRIAAVQFRPSKTFDPWKHLPAGLRRPVEAELKAGELPLAWFEPDLDGNLCYAAGLVVLTPERLLSVSLDRQAAEGPADTPSQGSCRCWALGAEASLRVDERAGVGTLELLGPDGRIAFWRYTVARSNSARRFVERSQQLRRPREQGGQEEPRPTGSVCPTCGETLLSPQLSCPVCSDGQSPPTRTLLRLLQFARPRTGDGNPRVHVGGDRHSGWFSAPLPDDAAGGQRPRAVSGGQGGRFHAGPLVLGRSGRRRAAGLAVRLGADLRAGLGQRADRRRPAQPRPTRICSGSRWSSSAASAPAT